MFLLPLPHRANNVWIASCLYTKHWVVCISPMHQTKIVRYFFPVDQTLVSWPLNQTHSCFSTAVLFGEMCPFGPVQLKMAKKAFLLKSFNKHKTGWHKRHSSVKQTYNTQPLDIFAKYMIYHVTNLM